MKMALSLKKKNVIKNVAPKPTIKFPINVSKLFSRSPISSSVINLDKGLVLVKSKLNPKESNVFCISSSKALKSSSKCLKPSCETFSTWVEINGYKRYKNPNNKLKNRSTVTATAKVLENRNRSFKKLTIGLPTKVSTNASNKYTKSVFILYKKKTPKTN